MPGGVEVFRQAHSLLSAREWTVPSEPACVQLELRLPNHDQSPQKLEREGSIISIGAISGSTCYLSTSWWRFQIFDIYLSSSRRIHTACARHCSKFGLTVAALSCQQRFLTISYLNHSSRKLQQQLATNSGMAAQTCSSDILQQHEPEHRRHHVPGSLMVNTSGRSGVQRNVGVVKGDGELSYAKNSQSQAKAVQELVAYIEEAVDTIRLPSTAAGPVIVADLGCASGSNTLKNVDIIVNRLKNRYAQSCSKEPDVSVFFNNLPSNDFNNLFQLVAEDCLTGYSANPDACGKYFAAGVPGSFYSRLFPQSFVHVFFSSYCLHWLSKVPDAVVDRNSSAFNKNSCWIQDASAEVIEAYREQSDKDLSNFLRCRAQELRSGGLLFLLFFARDTSHEVMNNSLFGDFWRLMDLTFQSLVSEGIITEEQRSTFNVPTFARSMEEISEVVDTFRGEFVVKKLEMLPIYHFADFLGKLYNDGEPKILAKKVLLMLRTTKEPLVEAHIGPAMNKIFWDRCTELLLSSDLVGKVCARVAKPEPLHQVLMALIRK